MNHSRVQPVDKVNKVHNKQVKENGGRKKKGSAKKWAEIWERISAEIVR